MKIPEEYPIRINMPFLPPLEEFQPFLNQIWESKWLTNNGRFHQELEAALCDYLGVKYISLFSNGTLALVTALQSLRITGEVITTPYSFVATTHAIWWNNIKPVFVDIEPDTLNIDPAKIEAAITSQTTAILPVHVYGNPCKVNELKEIADTYNLKIIYDACHTFGVKLKDVPILNFGDLSVMSFHATKVYNTFEGGAIVCHDETTKKRIDNLKNFGYVNETTVAAPGINAKMNEFQAAFGLLQLKYIDKAIARRKEIASFYRLNLKGVNGIDYLDDFPDTKHCYSYFPVFVDAEKFGKTRDELFQELKANDILARRYFYPLISEFPTYRGLPSANKNDLAVADKISKSVLCLPIYPELTELETKKIVDVITGK